MKLFKELNQYTVFTVEGSREVCIKHSNAVSFNLEGKDCIFALNDRCYPKIVDKETFNTLMNHVNNHNSVFKKKEA